METIGEYLWTPQFWFVVGILCLIMEIFTISFFFMFIGAGALAASLTTWLGLTPSFTGQMLVFSVITLVITAIFRKMAIRWLGQHNKAGEYSEFLGQKVAVVRTISHGRPGRVSFRGTEWNAESLSGQDYEPGGDLVEIVKVDGITLWIK